MAAFSVASVFSDNSVLQRDRVISVFGEGSDGLKVSASLIDSEGKILCENSGLACGGKWKVLLGPLPAMDGLKLEVSSSEGKKSFSNIAIGEVWLAGGQSNMEFELQNCTEGPFELESVKNVNVRFYYTQKNAWMDEKFFEGERKSAWQTWDSETKTAWSAVGYFFGKKLSEDLGVTVGIIGCNWGGTSASAWIPECDMENDSDLRTYLDEYREAEKGKSVEEQCRAYDEYEAFHAEWQKKCDALYKENPDLDWNEAQKIIGECKWPGPKCCKSPYRPAGLYECMISRISPYTLRGFIYYQGESDDHKPQFYGKLFRQLIDRWRKDWGDSTLPFIFVQLPENRYKQDKDLKNWCIIREKQAWVASSVANTGMTVASGLGQYNDIHPKAKKTLAERMEKEALYIAYGLISKKLAEGPSFKCAINRARDGKNEMLLYFNNAEDGFVLKDDSETLEHYKFMENLHGNSVPENFTGFELAGLDGKYYPADFHFESAGTIVLSSPDVENPISARYAWYNYGPITIYGKNGIPLAPFRSETKIPQ